MKVECPVCHMQGILEKRGNSERVLHYKGYSNGKRIYEKHTINGNKSLGIKTLKNSFSKENSRVGRLAWLGHWLYEPKVAGSSPARPTIVCFVFSSSCV